MFSGICSDDECKIKNFSKIDSGMYDFTNEELLQINNTIDEMIKTEEEAYQSGTETVSNINYGFKEIEKYCEYRDNVKKAFREQNLGSPRHFFREMALDKYNDLTLDEKAILAGYARFHNYWNAIGKLYARVEGEFGYF